MLVTPTGHAETRLAFKSAQTTSPYYQMALQIAAATAAASGGELIIDVEDSQGPVQNLEEAAMRAESYVFTTPPALIDQAVAGEDPFEPSEHYADIRALFPLPSLVMHFVVRDDSGISSFTDLAGKNFSIVKDDFGYAADNVRAFLAAIGLTGRIQLPDVDVNVDAAAALVELNADKVQGLAMAAPYPAANVSAGAQTTPIRLLGMNKTQLELIAGTKLVIPAGTYPGVADAVTTISLPVAAYALTAMDEETAYRLTRTFWERKDSMAQTHPWWQGVSTGLLTTLGTVLHDGALRYYREHGIGIPAHLQ
jgi:TRAP transporter TAXI family solute receptor